jgi:hypothetical protein
MMAWLFDDRWGMIQAWMGLFIGAWGIWLLAPWPMFAVSDTYDAMRILAPEWVWGLFGLGMFALIWIGGISRRDWISWGLLGCTGLLALIATMMILGNYRSSASAAYPLLTLLSSLLYIESRMK